MPVRRMTTEQAVEAISDAIREVRAAASTLEARLPDNTHQERAVRVMNYESDELASAYPVLREALGLTNGSATPMFSTDAGGVSVPQPFGPERSEVEG